MSFSVSLYAAYTPLTVRLNAVERFIVASLLPQEASFEHWKIINDLKDQLAPSEEEAAKLDMKASPTGGITAKWDAIPEKEITFGEVTEKMIIDALKKLDKESKLLPEHISIYEKFIK